MMLCGYCSVLSTSRRCDSLRKHEKCQYKKQHKINTLNKNALCPGFNPKLENNRRNGINILKTFTRSADAIRNPACEPESLSFCPRYFLLCFSFPCGFCSRVSILYGCLCCCVYIPCDHGTCMHVLRRGESVSTTANRVYIAQLLLFL